MASPFSVSGLASNIDTKAMVEQLISLERAPARLAEASKATQQARLDVVKAMNTKLLALRDAIDGVEPGSVYSSRTATSSQDATVSATATSGAVIGGMTVNVKKLAAAHQVATLGQSDASTNLGVGLVVLRLGGATSDTVVEPTTHTLAGIAEAINAANVGVTASVVNDGQANPYRLVVTSNATGTANAITMLEGTGGYAGILPDLASLNEVTAASNAEVRIGHKDTGLLLTSAGNTMDQAIPGLTLKLKAVADNVQITVAQDTAGAAATVQKLISGYNDARTYFANNSTYDPATKRAGPLFGDYDLRSRLDAVENALTKTFTAQPSGYQRLADVGVTIGSDGKMAVSESVLAQKLAANPTAVADLFNAAGTAGSSPMDSLTRSVNGTMALKQSTLEGSISSLTDRIAAIDARLERRKAFYQAKFLAMEKITAQMQSQGNSLTNFVTNLNKSK